MFYSTRKFGVPAAVSGTRSEDLLCCYFSRPLVKGDRQEQREHAFSSRLSTLQETTTTNLSSILHSTWAETREQRQGSRNMCHRFDGVAGYRICLTHRRSSVRSWVESERRLSGKFYPVAEFHIPRYLASERKSAVAFCRPWSRRIHSPYPTVLLATRAEGSFA